MKRTLTVVPPADILTILIIGLAGWVYTSDIHQFIDVKLFDESYYLASGLAAPRGLPRAEQAPLYALWYYLLSLIKHDSIELAYFNYRVMTVLPAAALFAALRVTGVPRVFSLWLSLWLLLSSANFPIWPKVSHFALVVLLLGVIGAGLSQNRTVRIAILTVACLAASYARPELFLSALLFGLVFILVLPNQIKSEGLKSVLPLTGVSPSYA